MNIIKIQDSTPGLNSKTPLQDPLQDSTPILHSSFYSVPLQYANYVVRIQWKYKGVETNIIIWSHQYG